jgi:hypothetical protein
MSPARTARLVGTVDFFGQTTEVAVLATLRLNKGRADIVPVDARLVDGTGLPVPGSVLKQVLDLFRVPLITGDLPLDVTADTFQAKDGTLQISGRARNLTLD